jgi:hypothetical protein
MNKKPVKIIALVTLATLGAFTSGASARTQPAASGTSSNGSLRDSFAVDGNGVRLGNPASAGTWIVPLAIDVASAKTINFRGSLGTGGSLQCIAVSHNSAGAPVATSALVPLPPFATSANVTLTAAQVPAGGTVSLLCAIAGTAQLVSVDYNQ